MLIPAEIMFSDIRGGVFETEGRRGWWWRKGKLIAEWKWVKDHVEVTWHQKR